MNEIGKIVGDGFSLSPGHRQLTDVALLSLRTALKAYFSTYRIMKGRLLMLEGDISGLSEADNQLVVDYHHDPNYCQAYSEVIFHFHHFIELTIKELLRCEHPLLATDASKKPIILHKMLMNRDVDPIDQEQLKFLNFSQASGTLYDLVRSKQLSNHQRLKFIVDARPWLDKLNGLRNRVAHRGTYILRYSALDKFVGQFILPFVLKVLRLPIYSSSEFKWQFLKLNCKTNPIKKIAKEATSPKPDTRRMALLKELGRAAYENPLPRGPFCKQKGTRAMDPAEKDAERMAKSLMGESDVTETRICPVCGVKALLVFGDIRSDVFFDDEEGQVIVTRAEFFTYAVRCLCCSFEIEDEIGDESFKGLPIKSYWRVEELIPS